MTREHLYAAIWIVTVIAIPVLWISSLRLQVKTFNNLYRTIDDMNAQLALIGGMLGIRNINPSDVLPTNCYSCGVTLQGGATQHKPNCEIRKLIDKNFPPVQ